MKRSIFSLALLLSFFFVISQTGCSHDGDHGHTADGGGGGVCPETNVDISVCDPEVGMFSLVIDNGFFPLVVGAETVLEGVDDEGVEIRVEISVLDETEEVAGVTTRVVVETEFEDGELVEISRNFYAQAPDGTVCYFGEDVCIIPPNSFALARTIEYFRIPRSVMTICLGKSTYARTGIITNVTPFEPEWEGYVTMEISNTTPLPAKIYANEGIAQVLFFDNEDICEVSYADKKGKYQKQTGITPPKV